MRGGVRPGGLRPVLRAVALSLLALPSGALQDVVLFDFETPGRAGWTVSGEAFGSVRATGAFPGQSPVSGFLGRGLANSFVHGDAAVGTLLSEPFEITRRCLRFFVGGGDTGVGVLLQIEDGPEFEATGERSEILRPVVWDLAAERGKRARLVLYDRSSAPWGHLLADAFMLTDDPTCGPPLSIGPRRRILDPSTGEGRFGLNDHCFVRAEDGLWHLFAIWFAEPGTPPLAPVRLAHATAPSLADGPWRMEERTLVLDPDAGETRLWAPHVVRFGERWCMLYHAGGGDERHARIHLARSEDLFTWQRERSNPVFTEGFQGRDPFLLADPDDARWTVYTTATFPDAGGHHTVSARTSADLVHWSAPHDAYRDPAIGTDFGPTESPCVVRRGEYAYLFLGSSEPGDYDRTRVFRSRDARDWAPSDLVATLPVHGAEIVRDEHGAWYASHAGDGRGGLWLARIHWNDGLDDDGRPLE